MIILITGVPGSGKSLYAMQLMEEQLKQGREVYSDIDGCTLPGVLPAPEDWRTLPDGSYCVYDEAHQRFPATGKAGLSTDPRVQDLDTHRHHGYDLVYITQASTRLHHDIRKLAGRHIHVQRNFGANTVTLYMWERAANENDKQDRLQSDQQLWHYPKRLFSAYKSATVHTHKRRIPRKLAALLAVAAVLVSWSVYSLDHNPFVSAAVERSAASHAPETPVVSSAPKHPSPPIRDAWAANQTIPPVAGCISSKRACVCYAYSGDPISMSDAQCREAVKRPLPINVYPNFSAPPRASVHSVPSSSAGEGKA